MLLLLGSLYRMVKDKVIQLLVFEEANIKIYRCVKGDIGRREVFISFHFYQPFVPSKKDAG